MEKTFPIDFDAFLQAEVEALTAKYRGQAIYIPEYALNSHAGERAVVMFFKVVPGFGICPMVNNGTTTFFVYSRQDYRWLIEVEHQPPNDEQRVIMDNWLLRAEVPGQSGQHIDGE